MTEFVASSLSLKAGDDVLVDAASFKLNAGELVALLGPNGAGKTSLVRMAVGLERAASGHARIGGWNVSEIPVLERAKRIAYLPQTRPLAWPRRVRDVVALGRFSHGAALGRLKGVDAEAVDKALTACDLMQLADRRTDTLSGGELARVHCARAFAVEAPFLFADEPVAALDPRHQFRILDLIKSFVGQGGGALVILHDVGLAARYASRLLWMKKGRILADGPPSETLKKDRIESIYGVRARVDGLSVEMEGAA